MLSCKGSPGKLIAWLYDQDREKQFEVKEVRKRRSRSQNSYYWELNDKLADVLRMERMELHFRMLKSYAPCEVMSVLESVPLEDYFTYYEVFAHGVLNGSLTVNRRYQRIEKSFILNYRFVLATKDNLRH